MISNPARKSPCAGASECSTNRTSWCFLLAWSRRTSPSTALGQGSFALQSPPDNDTLTATPRVSALIVAYNTQALLLEAIASVVDEPGVETIVLDNASHDGSPAAVVDAFPT